jgi:hypothetical protein
MRNELVGGLDVQRQNGFRDPSLHPNNMPTYNSQDWNRIVEGLI